MCTVQVHIREGNKQQVKGSNGKSAVWTTRKSECFICGNQGHFARSCPEQFCQLCGKRGHGRRHCKNKNRVLLADIRNEHLHDSESRVVVRISLNDTPIIAMLDSGAQPSIVGKGTLSFLKVSYLCYAETVHGVGATPVSTLARVQLDVAIGLICSLKHMFLVLDTEEPTIILGRDFLSLFSSTEFDWANHKIRLGLPSAGYTRHIGQVR